MSEEFRGDEMPRLRRRTFIIRVFVSLAFLFTGLSVIITHSEVQLKHHTDTRSLDNGQSPIVIPHTISHSNSTRLRIPTPQVNESKSLERRTNDVVKTNITRKHTPAKNPSPKNLTFVLPRSQQHQLSMGGKSPNSNDVSKTLEEEQFIVVETVRARAAREKEKKKKEESLRKRTWEQVQEDRKHHLKDGCARHPRLRQDLNKIIYNERSRLSNFIVNDRLRVVFANVPMVASHLFDNAQHQPHTKLQQRKQPGKGDAGTFRNLSSYNAWEIRYRLTHYKKLIFVRDPFARVLSTYRRKFMPKETPEKKLYGRLIAQSTKQELQPELYSDDLNKGGSKNLNITFKEFVYFVNAFTNYLPDSQWYPMSNVALPCEIDYDFIGKLEDGPTEFANMMKSAGIEWPAAYGKPHVSSTSHQGPIYDKFFLQLWPIQIRELYRLYEADFDLFQYGIPTYMRPWVFDKF